MEGDALVSQNTVFVSKQGDQFYDMPTEWENGMRVARTAEASRWMADAGKFLDAILDFAEKNGEALPATRDELERFLPQMPDDAHFEYSFKGGKLPPQAERRKTRLGKFQLPNGTVSIFLNRTIEWTSF